MRRIFTAILVSLLTLSACNSGAEKSGSTDTTMDDLDSLEGTISDDAINLDQSTDEAPLEAAPPSQPGAVSPPARIADPASKPPAPATAAPASADEIDTE